MKAASVTECVVAVDFWFLGWLTLQLNGFRARENIQGKQIQILKFAKFIYFMRFKENPLPDSWIPRWISLEKKISREI